MPGSKTESLRVGSACALIGVVGVGAVALVKPESGSGHLFVAAVLASFLSGSVVWALCVARHPNPSRRRVALVMASAAVLGHFLTWAIFSLMASPQPYLASPAELLKVPFVSFLFGLGSLVVIGWLTIPLGVGIGLLFLRRRRSSSPTSHGPD